MITVDTSVLVAVLRGEPDADALLSALNDADAVQVSAASYVEAGVVIDGTGDPVLSARLDELLDELDAVVVDVTSDQALRARRAYRDYGKGTGHPAQLNFGDCFSYALASATRTPLLFKGSDFGHTDIHEAPTNRAET